MNETIKEGVYRSKWGFHSCSKETSKKLRFLNGVYQMALGKASAWNRWDRKQPQNRVTRTKIKNAQGQVIGYGEKVPVKEPRLCSLFSEKATRKVTWHPRGGYYKDGIDFVEVITKDLSIPLASHQGRMPVATAEEVKPLPITDQEIDRLYVLAKEWLLNL
jgi:hypothetical protein